MENEVNQIHQYSDTFGNVMRLFLPKNSSIYCGKIEDYFDFNNMILMLPQNSKQPILV
jgi:hypothetical protein